MKPNLMIFDPHIIVAEGIKSLLAQAYPEYTITLSNSVENAVNELYANEYNIALIDINNTEINIKEFITNAIKEYPQLKILILSSIVEPNIVREYLAIGVNGYLSKNIDFEELIKGIEVIKNGKTYINADLNIHLASRLFFEEHSILTKKEREILNLIAEGHSVKKIAGILYISTVTVMSHRRSIFHKLGFHSAIELVKYVYDNNLKTS